MHVANYLGLLHSSEQQLADALLQVAQHHGDEPDIEHTCTLLAAWSHDAIDLLTPLVKRYQEEKNDAPERLSQTLFGGTRTGSLALLRGLHDLWLLANEVHVCVVVLSQAAAALRDQELATACAQIGTQNGRQIAWCLTRIKQAAPQSLVVAA